MTAVTPPPPAAAAAVTYVRAFRSDRHGRYAFVFAPPGTRERTTAHTGTPYRYAIGAAYTLTVHTTAAPPGRRPPAGTSATRSNREEHR